MEKARKALDRGEAAELKKENARIAAQKSYGNRCIKS